MSETVVLGNTPTRFVWGMCYCFICRKGKKEYLMKIKDKIYYYYYKGKRKKSRLTE